MVSMGEARRGTLDLDMVEFKVALQCCPSSDQLENISGVNIYKVPTLR